MHDSVNNFYRLCDFTHKPHRSFFQVVDSAGIWYWHDNCFSVLKNNSINHTRRATMQPFQIKKLIKLTGILFLALHSVTNVAQAEHIHDRPDSHAPIGVMGDHLMEEGKWMTSYRFMSMHMDGMRSGTDDLTSEEVGVMPNALGGESMRMGTVTMTVPPTYRVIPLEMDMDMHMLGAMYGLSDDVTAMVMVNYVEKEMTSVTYGGMAGTTAIGEYTGKTSGFGDTQVAALIRLSDEGIHHFHLNAGVSLPTGSITESGNVLAPFGAVVDIDRLGYNMQLGSGTVDLKPGFTYTARQKDISWGGQAMATLRLYDNKEDYRLGNVFEGTAWVARQWQSWISTSARISAKSEGGIKGRDTVITGGSPVFDTANSGRDEVNLLLGVNLLGTDGWTKGQRLAFEVAAPVYEKVDGVQMSQDWTATLGWQAAF
jgi:hypothetical protein